MTKNKKLILGASHSVIEPLGLLHLSAIAKQEGWVPNVVLGKEPDFKEIDNAINQFDPSLLGFTLYTGNHIYALKYFEQLKAQRPDIKIAVGGPHVTSFPKQLIGHADYIAVSEGFESFRRILRGEAKPGIIVPAKLERFPLADREDFYRNSPAHRDNPIKNIITQTGCPYQCTYCYNSHTIEEIAESLDSSQKIQVEKVLGPSKRLFPRSVRPVEDIVQEIEDIKRISPETRMIFFQDDSFGADLNWLREFSRKYDRQIQFHAMTRFNFIDPKTSAGKERAKLMKEAGCTGLTLAIESADDVIRKEVLNRNMDEDVMFRAMDYAGQLGLKVRTFSMIGLPYGATSQPTEMNFEQDIKTLKLNVQLKEKTGLPTIAWTSILVPYPTTEIDKYCQQHGFYAGGDYNDVLQISYRRGSVLNFPGKWTGPGLSKDSNSWLPENEQRKYQHQLEKLMEAFPVFAMLENGHEIAREALTNGIKHWDFYSFVTSKEVLSKIPRSSEFLEDLTKINNPSGIQINNAFRTHIYDRVLYGVK